MRCRTAPLPSLRRVLLSRWKPHRTRAGAKVKPFGKFSVFDKRLHTASTKTAVSSRGISTPSPQESVRLIKSHSPSRYCSGSPVLRFSSAKSTACSASDSAGLSPCSNNSVRFAPQKCSKRHAGFKRRVFRDGFKRRFRCAVQLVQRHRIISSPFSGITAFIAAIAASIILSVGSFTVKR